MGEGTSSKPDGGGTCGVGSGEFGASGGAGGGSSDCCTAEPRCSFNLKPSSSSDNSSKLDSSRMRMISATSLAVSVNAALQKYSLRAKADSPRASQREVGLSGTTPSRGGSATAGSRPSYQSPTRYP